jgi:hypothetical protein
MYTGSRDPHITCHIVWQLEILPHWTAMAVQPIGEPGGPVLPELEVSEVELDCASFCPLLHTR